MSVRPAAVLTGDLVASTRHPAATVDRAMQHLHDTARDIGVWCSPPHDTRFTRYRGDGWQLVLAQPHHALRAAVVLQARLIAIGLRTRIFIGIGAIERSGTDSLADASGEAFERSGRGLDALGDASTLGIDGSGVTPEDQMIADLLGERIGRWTGPQAEAAAHLLASVEKVRTLSDIGARLGISPQAVNDRVRGAGCPTIASVLRRWEARKARGGWGGTR
ncbi:MAG: hypothetical protein ACK4GM_00315 [Tabrizicola sp.]